MALAAPVTAASLSLGTRAIACSMCSCGDPAYRMVGEEFFGVSPWRLGFDVDHTGEETAGEEAGTRENELETRYTLSGSRSPRAWLRVVGRQHASVMARWNDTNRHG